MDSTNFSNHLEGYSVRDTRFLTSTDLFGTCASWMFLSFIVVQAFTYFRHFKKDSNFLKAIVYSVILFQLLQTGTSSYAAYVLDSAGWGDPNTIFDYSLSVSVDLQPLFNSLTAFIVQCFFIWRIWTFSMSFLYDFYIRIFVRLVCAFITLVVLLSLGSTLSAVVSTLTTAPFPWWIRVVIVLFNISSCIADVTITISMIAMLLHAKASSVFGETRDLLSRLIRIVLQTGLLTSLLALLTVGFYFGHFNGLYAFPWYIIGETYVISLLANLNARNRSNTPVVHGSDNEQAPPPTKLSTMVFSPQYRPREEENSEHNDNVSFPVHSLVRTNDHRSISIVDARVSQESESLQGEMKIPNLSQPTPV